MKRVLLVAILLGVACKKEYVGGLARRAAELPRGVPVQLAQTGQPAPPPPPPPAATPVAVPNRMIVRNAQLSLVVRNAVDVLHKASALAESKAGYVTEERQWKEGEQVRASATLRIPAAQLRPVLATLSGFAVRVQNETISGEDVTAEFTDLGAQLKNLQATEIELRELLTTVRQRTQKASEIMEVFTELTKVRGDFERIQGRMQYLSQNTAMSTITLELVPDAIAAPVVEPGWQPVATIRAAARSLVNTLKGLADAAIWAVLYLLPIVAIFVGIALLIRGMWHRLQRSRLQRDAS